MVVFVKKQLIKQTKQNRLAKQTI